MKIFAKRILAVALSMVLALNMGIYTPDVAHAVEVQKEKTQTYIVQTTTESKLEALDRKYEEGNTVSDLSSDSMKEDNFTTLELTDSQAEALEKDKKVSIIERDIEVKGCSENITAEEGESEEKEDVEWNMQAIRLDEGGKTEEETDNTAKVKVALIDSGVDMFDDIEVKDYINLIPGEEEVLPLFWDTSGHGTSIAGVIAAQDNDE